MAPPGDLPPTKNDAGVLRRGQHVGRGIDLLALGTRNYSRCVVSEGCLFPFVSGGNGPSSNMIVLLNEGGRENPFFC